MTKNSSDEQAIEFYYSTDMRVENAYIDLNGHVRPRNNPTTGLYYFDGQFFYRKKLKR